MWSCTTSRVWPPGRQIENFLSSTSSDLFWRDSPEEVGALEGGGEMVYLDASSYLRRRRRRIPWLMTRRRNHLQLWAHPCLLCAVWPILVCLYLLTLNQSCDHHNHRNLKTKLLFLRVKDARHLLLYDHVPELWEWVWFWCVAGDEGLSTVVKLDSTCVHVRRDLKRSKQLRSQSELRNVNSFTQSKILELNSTPRKARK